MRRTILRSLIANTAPHEPRKDTDLAQQICVALVLSLSLPSQNLVDLAEHEQRPTAIEFRGHRRITSN